MNQRAQEIKDHVIQLVAPVLEQEDLVLFEVKVSKSGLSTSIEIIVDKAYGGLDLNGLSAINRRLRFLLEESGVATEGFSLWVSTPGVDRPLKEAKDFRRVIGRMVEIWVQDETTQDTKGPIIGVVGDVQEGMLRLIKSGQDGQNGDFLTVALERIVKAKQKI